MGISNLKDRRSQPNGPNSRPRYLSPSCGIGTRKIVRGFLLLCFFLWRCDPTLVMTSSFTRFLDHIQRRTTVGRAPLDEWSARRRDLYLTTHNTHNRQTSLPPVGFEPTISAGERPQTYVSDRGATGTGVPSCIIPQKLKSKSTCKLIMILPKHTHTHTQNKQENCGRK